MSYQDRLRTNLKGGRIELQTCGGCVALTAQVGRTGRGLLMLSESVNSCAALQSAEDLPDWAQGVFFFMAEGNYPFPSTYITYSLLPGHPTPLPAWPMRVACEGLNKDFGIRTKGSVRDVNYTLTLGVERRPLCDLF
jgi:lysosomal Pro-X carboxypeptidase